MSSVELQSINSLRTDDNYTLRLFGTEEELVNVPQPLPSAPGLVPNTTSNYVEVSRFESNANIPEQIKFSHLMTLHNPPRNKYRVMAICSWLVACGFADAAPGALLPHIEAHYNLNYIEVSSIWMSFACGFIVTACLSHKIQPLLGKRKSLVFGTFCQLTLYAIISSGALFPIIVVGFFIAGCGMTIVLSQANVFLAKFENLSKFLSVSQSLYGFGATVSPIIATSLVSAGVKWNYFYLILLSLMSVACISNYFSFKDADADLAPWDVDPNDLYNDAESSQDILRLTLKNKVTYLLGLVIFCYQGAEVSLGGWIVSFLLDYRKGPPSVGYVASGFWAGLSVGRLFMATTMHRLFNIRRSNIICSIVAIFFVILTWVIPNIIANGITVALAGLFVGPIYPLTISLSADLLPRKIIVLSLTFATAFGTSGGAICPFMVGLISQTYGTFVTLPIFIALFSTMLILWLCLPNRERMLKGQMNLNFWQKLW